MSNERDGNALQSQFSAVLVQELNASNERSRLFQRSLQDIRLEDALDKIKEVRDFIFDPSKILGNEKTKHGEIAEEVEVAVRNAEAIVLGEEQPASFIDPSTGERVGRTDAVDLFINGQPVQMKFCNGVRNSLAACIKHMQTYPDLALEAGYMIPGDYFDAALKLAASPPENPNKTERAILRLIELVEERTGRPFSESVSASKSNYASVQIGAIDETLFQIEADLEELNDEMKEGIDLDHAPSWQGMGKAAAISAGIAGGISFASTILMKARAEGKNPFAGDFNADDWKEIGLNTSTAAIAGGVSGAAIYALTNYKSMAAPLAGAYVGVAMSMASLTADLALGKLSDAEYLDMGMFVCSEAAVVYLATIAGQTIIPVPVLGGVIGSIAGKILLQSATKLSNKQMNNLLAEYDQFTKRIGALEFEVIAAINAEYDRLGNITAVAFDVELNKGLWLSSSADLAEAYGVNSDLILRTQSDVDDYFLR